MTDSDAGFLEKCGHIFDALIENRNFKYLMNIGSELLGNPIVFQDTSGKFVALSSTDAYDKDFFDGFFDTAPVAKITAETEGAGIYSRVFASDEPVFGHFSYYEHDILGRRIVVHEQVVGSIGMLLENDLGKHDIELYEKLAQAISLQMAASRETTRGAHPAYSLVHDLLEGSVNEAGLASRLDMLHITAPERMYLFVVLPVSDTSDIYMNSMTSNVAKKVNCPLCLVYKSNALIVISEQDFEKDAVQRICSCYDNSSVDIGVSEVFESLTTLDQALSEAIAAIELYDRLGMAKTPCLHGNVRIYHLLTIGANSGLNLDEFYSPEISRLSEYDDAHDTQLTDTLEAYLECGRNMSACAAKLYTHRNTIHYRIERIKTLVNIDFNDDDRCFALEASFKLRKLAN